MTDTDHIEPYSVRERLRQLCGEDTLTLSELKRIESAAKNGESLPWVAIVFVLVRHLMAYMLVTSTLNHRMGQLQIKNNTLNAKLQQLAKRKDHE